MIKLKNRGKSTLQVEVLNISIHGICLYVKGDEYFLPYKDFLWFRYSPLPKIQDVQIIHMQHLHWPQLDIDLEVDSLKSAEQYKLLYI